jgi:hypothetical protein
MRGVSPSGSGLIPAGYNFLERDVSVLEEGRAIGVGIVVEIGGIGVCTAHVLSGEHAFVFGFG